MNPPTDDSQIPHDNAPPTRDEMEEMAKRIGVPFNRKTTDETLLTRINEAVNVLDKKTTD
jgi:hypothetical protein